MEDPAWNRRYDGLPLSERPRLPGGYHLQDGDTLVDEIDVPNAHPRGSTPYGREDYIREFLKLSDGIVSNAEADPFLHLVHRLPDLGADDGWTETWQQISPW